jgi:CRP-like cAMP-binding protein
MQSSSAEKTGKKKGLPATESVQNAPARNMSGPSMYQKAKSTNLFLAALPVNVVRSIECSLKCATVREGDVLLDVRERIRRVYFPLNAVISMVVPLSDGQNIETATVGRDGVIGALAIIGAAHSVSRAVVQISGDCLFSEGENLRSAIASNPELRSMIIAHEEALFFQVQQSAACNAHHNLENRLARRLLRAADLQQSDEVLVTQECLAEMLGARRTTVTIIAQKFQAAGMIRYTRGRIRICDTGKLRNAACECYEAIKSDYAARVSRPKALAISSAEFVEGQ